MTAAVRFNSGWGKAVDTVDGKTTSVAGDTGALQAGPELVNRFVVEA